MASAAYSAASLFLSTPSARRATRLHREQKHRILISIHALREEGDATTGISGTKILHFYPRPPRGGRPGSGRLCRCGFPFLSTPSARRATYQGGFNRDMMHISIHALREEGDTRLAASWLPSSIFLSTPSARRATGGSQQHNESSSISIHALREEGDWV